ncbi:MAG: carbohydrate kinase family protein [Victivallaceae bacterium]|nr:carbohydrate kinase family protein [Victivallaceae bacterium]
MEKELTVSCAGCCLADYLYAGIDVSKTNVKKYLSVKNGDGGITPGKLIFTDDLERFADEKIDDIINDITEYKSPDVFNLGGPAIVALAGAAQLLADQPVECNFYGVAGDDDAGEKLYELMKKLPVKLDNYHFKPGATSSTIVLSDPSLNNGKGERAFINNLGVSRDYQPEGLGEEFFDADVIIYGATALVPQLHTNLTSLLRKGRDLGRVNIVTTVYDFINEKANPDQAWPLGESDESYRLLDLLLVDYEEAMRLSNSSTLTQAIEFFMDRGVAAMVITHGSKPVTFFSNGSLFKATAPAELPICKATDRELERHPEINGDTTGCGDNFAGGVIYSLLSQLANRGRGELDLAEAVSWGAVAGGFTRFYIGGTYFEQKPGEKLTKLTNFYKAYRAETE